jgi:hypothetical protein
VTGNPGGGGMGGGMAGVNFPTNFSNFSLPLTRQTSATGPSPSAPSSPSKNYTGELKTTSFYTKLKNICSIFHKNFLDQLKDTSISDPTQRL